MELGREKLSRREEEILQLAAQGFTDKEIASQIGVQMSTVRTYWDRIKIKLLATNRTEAVARSLKPSFAAMPELAPFDGVAHAIPHMLALMDPDGKIEFANSKWQKYFAVEPLHEIDWLDLVHADDRGVGERLWNKASARRKEQSIQLRCRRNDGTFRWHLMVLTPFRVRHAGLFR
jgi:PAS domain S-box-containing protein